MSLRGRLLRFFVEGIDYPLALAQPDSPPASLVPSALETAAGLAARAVSVAVVEGAGAAQFTPSVLSDITYHMIVSGEWWGIQTQPLTRIPVVDILPDGSYSYTNADGSRVQTTELVHCVWLPGPDGHGVGPLDNAPYVRAAALRLERAISQEAGSIVGSVVKVSKQTPNKRSSAEGSPERARADELAELGNLDGGTKLIQSVAPERRERGADFWIQHKWQPRFDERTADMHRELSRSIWRAVGIPLALVEGVGSTLKVEDIRLLTWLLADPIARRIQDAASRQAIDVSFRFDDLDTKIAIAQKSAGLSRLLGQGYSQDEAEEIMGIIA